MTVGFQFPASFRRRFALGFCSPSQEHLKTISLSGKQSLERSRACNASSNLEELPRIRSSDKDEIFPVTSSITSWLVEIRTISALQVRVTLAGLPGKVTAVEAAVRRAMLVRDVGRRGQFCFFWHLAEVRIFGRCPLRAPTGGRRAPAWHGAALPKHCGIGSSTRQPSFDWTFHGYID